MTRAPSTPPAFFGLFLFLAAAAGLPEPSPGQEPPPDKKHPLASLDPKSLEDPATAAKTVAMLEKKYEGKHPPESVRMLLAILRGPLLSSTDGWFGPPDTRYTWKWLADRSGLGPAKTALPRDRFPGPDAWFATLDRNRDGAITPNDLDWSDKNPDVQMGNMVNRVFRYLNTGGNGRLTKDELLKFFEKAADGKEFLTPDAFRAALMGGMSGGFLPGDAPTKEMLIRGLFSGELGSIYEGPLLNHPAPNFTLTTVDGKATIELAKLIGEKPVVLVFGNFTCSPFRSLYASVASVHERFGKDAHFLMVYVREAHPTDGWKMESNTRVGVALKQPTTLAERSEAAGKFCARLKPAMPVVVDLVEDPNGHAYSAMPARLYVIDRAGQIAYKSGRGPFGFRPGEMEQALVMALLEQMKK